MRIRFRRREATQPDWRTGQLQEARREYVQLWEQLNYVDTSKHANDVILYRIKAAEERCALLRRDLEA